MYDFIFNVQPQAQKILFGPPWDAFLPPLMGSIIAIVVSVAIAAFTIKRTGDSNRRHIDAVERSSREHIEAVEKASADQIIEARYWRDVKRKQQLRSLIQELEENVKICNYLMEKANRNDYNEQFFSFFLLQLKNVLPILP
jgi:hypothetical protein